MREARGKASRHTHRAASFARELCAMWHAASDVVHFMQQRLYKSELVEAIVGRGWLALELAGLWACARAGPWTASDALRRVRARAVACAGATHHAHGLQVLE